MFMCLMRVIVAMIMAVAVTVIMPMVAMEAEDTNHVDTEA